MVRALLRKEFRELAPIALLATIAYLLVIGGVIGTGALVEGTVFSPTFARSAAFANSGFLDRFILVAQGFATALGFRQTLGEEYRGTYLVLLHRPLRREAIMAAKMLTSLALLLSVSALAILGLAFWAMTPGNQPAPFVWPLTIPCWIALLTTPTFYLGAFLSGLRPARWIGTKLLPWVAGITLPAMVTLGDAPNLILLALADIAFVIAILWVARERDYG